MMRSIESASSVFYQSQEEDAVKTGSDFPGSYREAPLYDSYQDSMPDSPVPTEHDTVGKNPECMHLVTISIVFCNTNVGWTNEPAMAIG